MKQSFEFLHVYKCKNTFQLLATLKIIPSTLIPRVYNSGGALGCIILDNVTAYWDLAKEIKSQLNDERYEMERIFDVAFEATVISYCIFVFGT